MRIPSVDLRQQTQRLQKEIGAAIRRVLRRCDFILGKEVLRFEEAVQDYCGIRYALAVSNGTDALRLCLLATGIRPKQKVICPAFTYYATAGAIASIGAIPVFVDIDPLTYNISLEALGEVVAKEKDIRAIIVVHLYGQCADMHGIISLCKDKDIRIIEDVAQAFGAEYKHKKAGTLGEIAAVSFFPSKNLGAFGDAGMVLTQNRKRADLVTYA